MFENLFLTTIPVVAILGTFGFLMLTVWGMQRRRERELHYRHELHRQLIAKGLDGDGLVRLFQGEQQAKWASRREGLRLAGLVTLFFGIAFMLAFQFIEDIDMWKLGWLPVGLGAALALWGQFLAPRPPAP
jgi:hypothetical protein